MYNTDTEEINDKPKVEVLSENTLESPIYSEKITPNSLEKKLSNYSIKIEKPETDDNFIIKMLLTSIRQYEDLIYLK